MNSLRDSAIEIDFEAVQNTKLFQKFVQREEAKAKIPSKLLERSLSTVEKFATPVVVRYEQSQQSMVELHVPELTTKHEQLYDDSSSKIQTQNTQFTQQIDRLNGVIQELRRKAFDENHSHQLNLLSLQDQVQGLQDKVYQLQKSEDYLQMDNERLRSRITQESLLRSRVEEECKEITLKRNELIDQLSLMECQIQRQREDLVHTRTQSDQHRSDTTLVKQQLQMLQERNNYLESQVRNEHLRKEMSQSQLLDCQERLHRGQNDLESLRSELLEQRRQYQEAVLEIESLRKQVMESKHSNVDYGRQQGSFQQQLFQSNLQVENLKAQLSQQLMTQPRIIKPQVQDYYVAPLNNSQFMKKDEMVNVMQGQVQEQILDKSYDKYQKYQNQMNKQTQAQQGGQNYFKEKDLLQEQNDRDIKEVEQQLLNTQVKRQTIASDLKKLESSKVRTGANIKKKVELEDQLLQNEQQVVSLRNKLRDMNALFI